MAKVKINFQPSKEKLEEFRKRSRDPKVFMRLGIKAQSILYNRVKSGYGVTKLPTSKNEEVGRDGLTSLSPAYKRYREKLVKRGFPLGKFGAVGKSNLTFTGQMLDSIKPELTMNGFVLKISGERKDGKTNEKVAWAVQKMGRPFFALTNPEVKIIQKEYDRFIRNLAKTMFKGGR